MVATSSRAASRAMDCEPPISLLMQRRAGCVDHRLADYAPYLERELDFSSAASAKARAGTRFVTWL